MLYLLNLFSEIVIALRKDFLSTKMIKMFYLYHFEVDIINV
jgi:hypothetical protein